MVKRKNLDFDIVYNEGEDMYYKVKKRGRTASGRLRAYTYSYVRKSGIPLGRCRTTANRKAGIHWKYFETPSQAKQYASRLRKQGKYAEQLYTHVQMRHKDL